MENLREKTPDQKGNIERAVDELIEYEIIFPGEREEIEQVIREAPKNVRQVLKKHSTGEELRDASKNFVLFEKKDDDGVELIFGREVKKNREKDVAPTSQQPYIEQPRDIPYTAQTQHHWEMRKPGEKAE